MLKKLNIHRHILFYHKFGIEREFLEILVEIILSLINLYFTINKRT